MLPWNEITLSSFLMAGYECADHVNTAGKRVRLLGDTHHDVRADEDYELLAPLGIKTVREGIQWGWIERSPCKYNWDEVKHRIEAGQRHGIQQMWDICHMGIPDDLVPTHPAFADRLTAVTLSFVDLWNRMTDQRLILVPVNEMGFLSWYAGEMRGTVPFSKNQGYDLKVHLLKACMQTIDHVKAADSSVVIMHTEPLINICVPENDPALHESAIMHNEYQYEAMDIMAGLLNPEMGGKPSYIDLLGINFYPTNQWEFSTNHPICWNDAAECRWKDLHELIGNVATRYNKPIIISETSHVLDHRADWIRYVADECVHAMAEGADIRGLCIYPAIDRHDWNEPYDLHAAGIWTFDEYGNRKACEPYVHALAEIGPVFNLKNASATGIAFS